MHQLTDNSYHFGIFKNKIETLKMCMLLAHESIEIITDLQMVEIENEKMCENIELLFRYRNIGTKQNHRHSICVCFRISTRH